MAVTLADSAAQLFRRQVQWARRVGLERKLAVALLAAALIAGLTTYGVLTGSFGAAQKKAALPLLLTDLIVLLLLGIVLARRLVTLWIERRRGLAGARLHARMVLLFSLAAVTPTIIVAVFTTLFLNLGVDAWFSERVSTAVNDSLQVAQTYLQEHQQHLGDEALAMASDLQREGPLLTINRKRFEQVLSVHAALRQLNEAAIIDGRRDILVNASFNIVLAFALDLPDWAFNQARQGQVVVLPNATGDRVRALVRLDPSSDTFLYIGRLVDPKVLSHVDKASSAARIYQDLERRRSGVQITFGFIFVVVALLVLCAAIWLALVFASQLVRPVGLLADAAERLRGGDFSVRVAEGNTDDEISTLSRAFNRMTSQLASQRAELIEANAQLDERRRFTELVLAGVSAGVIGLDEHGRIELPNRSACELLSVDLTARVGERLADIVPEMARLLETAIAAPGRPTEAQINIGRAGSMRTLLVRVGAERGEGERQRFVVTFDDVTELLGAQRKAAWADVARRIAHEIKNPLTPIQLSAERLKRKYLKQIVDDPTTFAVCTDTIVRQVGDIGRMVDEFSAFARMPAPVMRSENIVELCRQALFLQQSAHPQVKYHVALPDTPVMLDCDATQVSRALTNLLQNAADAIDGRIADGQVDPPGEIWLSIKAADRRLVIGIDDNGRGLPKVERHRLTEPYVTTRAKGTGLGLAIVKKIMEDHGGDLILDDRLGGGASVKLVFASESAPVQDIAATMADMKVNKSHGA
ncbi:MAG: two-component system, NtrC family, nitrogen regulation sensor histidine kinase NtrY [Rhodospirillaceae bacterium]|nr:two-component system, NtrC family, nitrogen regulation sensor histidine kinase NtrY [Rhodospirillaceae bacterium]